MTKMRLTLRKIREILRLKEEAGLSNRAIVRNCYRKVNNRRFQKRAAFRVQIIRYDRVFITKEKVVDYPPIPIKRKKWTDTSGFTGRIVPDWVVDMLQNRSRLAPDYPRAR